MLRLAVRNVIRQPIRTGLTLAAVAFGVIGLILAGGFVQDLFMQLGEAVIHSQSGHLQIARSGFFRNGMHDSQKYLSTELPLYREALLARPEIDDVLARTYFSGLLNNGRADFPIRGEGIEPDRENKLGTYIRLTAGRHLAASDPHGILIGAGLAHSSGLKPGDHATIIVNSAGGAINTADFVVVGIFETYSKDFDARSVRVEMHAAFDLLEQQGCSVLVASLKETADTPYVAQLIDAEVVTRGFELRTWRQLNDFFDKTVRLYDRQFGVLQLMVLLMVLLGVANSINMSTFERTSEFGAMIAMGTRRFYLARLILVESLIVGILGATIGAIVGVFSAQVVSLVGIPMPPPPNSNLGYLARIQLIPAEIATAYAVGILATVGASIVPAWRVLTLRVVEALHHGT